MCKWTKSRLDPNDLVYVYGSEDPSLDFINYEDIYSYKYSPWSLPPDCSVWWSVGFRVAQNLDWTGFRLTDQDGRVYNYSSKSIKFPTERPLSEFQEFANVVIEIPNRALLRFGEINDESPSGINVSFENLSGGYETSIQEDIYIRTYARQNS